VYGGGELFSGTDTLGQLASLIAWKGYLERRCVWRTTPITGSARSPFMTALFYNGGYRSRLWGTLGFTGRVTLDGTARTLACDRQQQPVSLGYAVTFSIEPGATAKPTIGARRPLM
jgi:hypothetical protein